MQSLNEIINPGHTCMFLLVCTGGFCLVPIKHPWLSVWCVRLLISRSQVQISEVSF